MIPRTVQMAAEVAAQFTSTQLDDYGNIILNGYATTGPNTTGIMSWAWPDSPLLPAVPLPSVTSVEPVLKGWTTNYQEYYTQLQPNGYGVNPGDPTMFEYTVHSYSKATGGVGQVGQIWGGTGYTPGTYTNLPAIGGTGTGATLDVVVGPTGSVTSVTINNPGSGYSSSDYLTVTGIGPGTGFIMSVAGLTGAIATLTLTSGGNNYVAGTYPGLTLTGGSGTGATADIVTTSGGGPAVGPVAPGGATLIQQGTGYYLGGSQYNYPTTTVTGSGSGFELYVNTTYVPDPSPAPPRPPNYDVIDDIGLPPPGVFPPGFITWTPGNNYAVGDIVQVPPAPGTFSPYQYALIRIDGVTGAPPATVTAVTLVNGGSNYKVGDVVTATVPGGGSGFTATVTAVTPGAGGGPGNQPAGLPRWSQPPRRLISNQVADFVPPGPNQQAIPYSAILYPVADNPTAPPIDTL